MKISQLGLIAIFAFCVVGCQKTSEGAKEDIRDNSINASTTLKKGFDDGANMAKNAAIEVKEAGKNLGAAAQLTPRVKNALNAEPKLNADSNLIDVDSTKEEVTLSGHVTSESLKALAGKLAKEELVKAKASQKLTNNLRVQIPSK